MNDPIELTRAEVDAAAAVVDIPGGMGFYDRCHLVDTIVVAINKARAENAVFRALTRDLERINRSDLTYDDQARDLLLSYDITPKPVKDSQ